MELDLEREADYRATVQRLYAEKDELRAELADLWNLSRRIVIRYRRALQEIAANEHELIPSDVAHAALSGEYDSRFEKGL